MRCARAAKRGVSEFPPLLPIRELLISSRHASHRQEDPAAVLGCEGPLGCKGTLEAWHAEAQKATWHTPQEIKAQFCSASVLKGGRIVFNIGGNKYRLVVAIDYVRQACFVKFIGTHAQYDAIDAETVQ